MADDLNDRIAKAQAELDAQKRTPMSEAGKGMGLGMRMASDFVAAVIVGLVLGWGIDAVFGLSPWGLIVCLLVGFITGVRNVVRQANAAQTQTGPASSNDGGGKTDEDNGA